MVIIIIIIKPPGGASPSPSRLQSAGRGGAGAERGGAERGRGMGNPHHRKHGGETEKAWRKDRGAQARKAKAKAGTAGGGDAAGGGAGGPVVSEPVWWRASFPVARGEPSEVVLGKAEGGGPALSGFCPFSQNLEVRDDSLRAQHLRQPALRRH